MERRSSFVGNRNDNNGIIGSSPSRPTSSRILLPIRAPVSSQSLDPTPLIPSPSSTPRPSSIDSRSILHSSSSPSSPSSLQPPSSPSGRLFDQPALPPSNAFTKKFPELLMAIRIGHISRCALLLEKSPGSANAIDGDGTPALMRAAMLGHADIVTLLIHRGAYTERRDPKGYTSLLHACERGKAKAVKALLDGGANPRVNTRQLLGHKFEILDDDTPMGLATEYGHTDVITVLQNFSLEEEKKEQAKEKELKVRRRKGLDTDEPIKTRAEIEKENKRKEEDLIAASNPQVVRVKESSESSSSRSLGLDDALNIAEEAEAAIRAAGGEKSLKETPNSLSLRRRHSMAAFNVAASMLNEDSDKKRDDEKSRRASMSELGDKQRRHSMAEFEEDTNDTMDAWGGKGTGKRSWGDFIRTSLRITSPKKGTSKAERQIISVGSETNAISSPLMDAAAKRQSSTVGDNDNDENEYEMEEGMRRRKGGEGGGKEKGIGIMRWGCFII